MNSLALAVFLLSAPGLLFNLGRRLVGRISQRQTRDFLSAFGELILLSAPLTVAIGVLANWLFGNSEQTFIESLFSIYALPDGSRVALVEKVPGALALGFAVCLVSGATYGSLRAWFGWFGFGERLPLEKLLTGYVRPGAYATVVTTTRLDKGVLVYRGFVENLQMSPEGNIDFIALSGAEKAYLKEPESGPSKASDFAGIVENAISASLTSILLIESEDIANILLTKTPSAGSANLIEWILYPLVRIVTVLKTAVGSRLN